MLTEAQPTKFQVIINGVPYGTPQPTSQLAELLLNNLTPDQRLLSEIRVVTPEGKQLLME